MLLRVKTTVAQEKEVMEEIRQKRISGNEKIWTYLVADILTNSTFKTDYISFICGEKVKAADPEIWYEAEPIPPRIGEGNTKLDLAFGSIRLREGTQLGIEYDSTQNDSWVCFVEAKFYSDCSTTVSNDPLRNQIIRVIENLLCFQSLGKFPKKLYFTLLTPRVFKQNPLSRLYGYKMNEYTKRDSIINDINISMLAKRNRNGWVYPDSEINERVKLLKINWISYEDILEREFNISNLDVTKDKWGEISGIADYFLKDR